MKRVRTKQFFYRAQAGAALFLISLMVSSFPSFTLIALAQEPPPATTYGYSNSLLNPATTLNLSTDIQNLVTNPSTNPIYNPLYIGGTSNTGSWGNSYGTSGTYGTPSCPGGRVSADGTGCDYGGGSSSGSTGSGASGVGGCAAGLLSSILGSVGFSIAGATFGKNTSTAAKGGAAGSVAKAQGEQAVKVPTVDTSSAESSFWTTISSIGDSISNFFSAITENKSLGLQEQERVEGFMGCIARSIARAMIQQIAQSTINWINSGFEGSPSFVSDPTSFFTNVADKAAGNFLQSSDLAFLCSPFSLQVKIAIANAYNGSSNSGMQCTLTGAVDNIENFMNNFSEGGWPAFISMTTNPTNQPFGAYMQASAGLNRAIADAVGTKQNQLALSGGFLDFQQKKNCKTLTDAEVTASGIPGVSGPNKDLQVTTNADGSSTYTVCDLVTSTPGSMINASLAKTLGMSYDQLNSAKYFDEIISALITQLMNKVLGSGGLSGLGSNYGGSSADFSGGVNPVAQLQNNVLANIPVYLQSAEQVLAIYNQDIALITPALEQANTTLVCLQNADGYSGLTAEQQAFVTEQLPVVSDTAGQLSAYLSSYQTQITKANDAIAALNQLQSEATNTTGSSNLQNLAANFTAMIAASSFPDSSTVQGAQEDYGTLTSQLDNVNQILPGIQEQCQALNVPPRTPPPPPPDGAPAPAPSCTLAIQPATITFGQQTTLTWSSANATGGSIDQNVGTVSPSGSQVITPATVGTITYTGIFTGAGGSTSCQASITVDSPPDPNPEPGG